MKRPWYETTYRWGQTNLTEDDPLTCDLDFWREQWKRTSVQGIIVNAGGIVAFYPSGFELQHRAKDIEARDLLGEFSQAAKECGIVVIARMDINRASKDFYDARPDWFACDKNGQPIISQGRYFSCVNSGYYSEYIPNVLREIIRLYQPVGFADNSWKGLGANTICYCENCREAFNEPLPEAVDWVDPVYQRWYKWSVERRTELWDLFNKTTAEAGGPDCLWIGMLPGDHHNLYGSLADMYALCKRSKIIFCDHQGREQDFAHNAMTGSLLRMASDENILVPESMANYVRGERTFRLAANPALETQMWAVSGISGGISPWYHHISAAKHDRRQFETPVPIFNWHKENEAYLYNRKDLAQIGLVWSQENSDFYGRGNKNKVAMPWQGFTKALTKARLSYMPINASDIGKYADRLKVLILPEIAILNDVQMNDVRTFVQKGGGLIFSGESHPQIFELTGLNYTSEHVGVGDKKKGNWEEFDAHNYLLLPSGRHEILNAFNNTDIIPFGGKINITKSNGTLKPLTGYVPNFPIYPPEFSYIREKQPEISGLFAGTLESGAKVVYFAADIDRCYGRHNLPDHGQLLSDAVQWVLGEDRLITVDGPGLLDCRAYSQDEKIIVHIVNLSGTNSYGYCDEIYPVGPVTININKPFSKAKLTVAMENRSLDSGIGLTIDKIGMHEMIVFS